MKINIGTVSQILKAVVLLCEEVASLEHQMQEPIAPNVTEDTSSSSHQ